MTDSHGPHLPNTRAHPLPRSPRSPRIVHCPGCASEAELLANTDERILWILCHDCAPIVGKPAPDTRWAWDTLFVIATGITVGLLLGVILRLWGAQ